MTLSSVIVFIDRKSGRGGGQVVLEKLLQSSPPDSDLHLFTTEEYASHFPKSLARVATNESALLTNVGSAASLVLVVNATSDFARGVLVARRMRRSGIVVRTIAILHNYPRSRIREFITRNILRRFDNVVAVEPGLTRLRRDATVPPWLSLDTVEPSVPDVSHSNRLSVKCFARPDPSKGLHLLPAIFRELEKLGVRCQVALGNSLEGRTKYERDLRVALTPWLVEGLRGPDWLEPGEIFLLPSISGEAACLSVQEVMARGCGVVASRVGLMPYIAPDVGAVGTFAPGDTRGAVQAVVSLIALPTEEYLRGCRSNHQTILARSGLWYDAVWRMIVKR